MNGEVKTALSCLAFVLVIFALVSELDFSENTRIGFMIQKSRSNLRTISVPYFQLKEDSLEGDGFNFSSLFDPVTLAMVPDELVKINKLDLNVKIASRRLGLPQSGQSRYLYFSLEFGLKQKFNRAGPGSCQFVPKDRKSVIPKFSPPENLFGEVVVGFWVTAENFKRDIKIVDTDYVGCWMPGGSTVRHSFVATLDFHKTLFQTETLIDFAYVIGKRSKEPSSLESIFQMSDIHLSRVSTTDFPKRFISVGDFGKGGETPVPAAIREYMNNNNFDAFVHLGDMSYASDAGECFTQRDSFNPACAFDCKGDNSECQGRNRFRPFVPDRWNSFIRGMDDILTTLPLMTTMGNHDNDLFWFNSFRPPHDSSFPGSLLSNYKDKDLYNSLFKNRSVSIDSSQSLQGNVNEVLKEPWFYTFSLGIIKFIVIGSEDNGISAYEYNLGNGRFYHPSFESRFNSHYGPESAQYKWFLNELETTDRVKYPWLIVVTHRPVFHTSVHHESCTKEGDWYGCQFRRYYTPLYEQYKVNLVLSGHAHHYQRSKNMVLNHERYWADPVPSSKGPIYIVAGTGGYRLDPGFRYGKNWVAKVIRSFGFIDFTVYNSSLIKWVFVPVAGADEDSRAILMNRDEIYIRNIII